MDRVKTETKDKILIGIRIAFKVVSYLLLCCFSLIMLYPLIYMLLAGFFTAEEYNSLMISGQLGLFSFPKTPTLKNYFALFAVAENRMLPVYFLNSLAKTLYVTFMTVATTMICGYAFSRLRFKISRPLLLVLIFCSMMPGTMSIIPTYIMYAKLHFLDTWAVYLIGGPAINVMGTFVMKQYLDSIPSSLDESAKLDGANVFQIIFRILLPVAKPMVAYIIITTAIGSWNDWSTGFFFTTSDKLQLLPSAISKISINASNGTALPDYPMMITMGLIVTVPALILYLIFQKSIVQGLAFVGIKG